MFSLLALVARIFRSEPAGVDAASPAAALLQKAGSRAGQDAHQAQELRAAASAWLSVIR